MRIRPDGGTAEWISAFSALCLNGKAGCACRGSKSTIRASSSGFTLVELLVVIAIMVLLMAIIVPVGKGLREGNAAMSCQARMQHIGVALKAYFMDEQGLPPLGVPVDGDGNPEDVDINTSRWPGLMLLYDYGYIGSRSTLHCPRDVYAAQGSAEYHQSYTDKDVNVKIEYDGNDIPVNAYRYMPHRWAPDTSVVGSDFYRQLDTDPGATVVLGGDDYKIVGPTFGEMPTDSAIVTWCDAHYESYEREDQGQYMVLFWDGTVQSLDGALFRDESIDPAAAWQVAPDDRAH
jgi:prepilin-type N-terminal cleavage/methylation domain-containing protein